MRIFRDLHLVEQLGSGIPRILKYYPRSVFHSSENFLRVALPSVEQAYILTEQVSQLTAVLDGQTLSTAEITTNQPGLKHRPTIVYHYIKPAIDLRLVEIIIPEKPNSRDQRHRLTGKGRKKSGGSEG